MMYSLCALLMGEEIVVVWLRAMTSGQIVLRLSLSSNICVLTILANLFKFS